MDSLDVSSEAWLGPIATSGAAPLPRGGHSLSLVDLKLYVFGGSAYNKVNQKAETPLTLVQDDLNVFDIPTRSWSTVPSAKGDAPSPRYAHSANVVGNQVLIFGGFNGKTYLSDLHVYDAASSTWSSPVLRGKAPPPRYAHTATLLTNGSLCFFGGCGEASVFNQLSFLDIDSLTWITPGVIPSGPIPSGRAYHTACLIGSNTLVVFGGRAGNKYYDDLYYLNTDTLVWSRPACTGTPPSSRAYHTALGFGSLMLIFGGMDGQKCFNDVYVLDTANSRWHLLSLSNPPPARHKHSMVLLGEQMIVFGGMEAPPNGFSDIWVLPLEFLHSFSSSGHSHQVMSPTSVSSPSSLSVAATSSFPPNKPMLAWHNPPSPSVHHTKHQAHLRATSQASSTQLSSSSSSSSSSSLRREVPMDVSSMDAEVEDMSAASLAMRISNNNGNPNPGANPNSKRLVSPHKPLQVAVASNGLRARVAASELKPPSPTAMEKQAYREEIARLQMRVDFLSGKNLEQATLEEIEELEKHFLDSLARVITVKKEKIVAEYERRLQDYHQALIHATAKPTSIPKNDSASSYRRKAREDVDYMEGVQSDITGAPSASFSSSSSAPFSHTKSRGGKGVEFGAVHVAEFPPAPGQGVPSGGAAPLGLGNAPVREVSEELNSYEMRRQLERRGVNRIPEEERINMLKEHGVPEQVIHEEARQLDELNMHRLQSIASPTENPLPEPQREMYRRVLNLM